MLLFGYEPESGEATAVWVDSWHMGDKAMICKGSVREHGELALAGSYSAPPGPDWGWQIDVVPKTADTFLIVMRNVSPEGVAELAVEAEYSRRS